MTAQESQGYKLDFAADWYDIFMSISGAKRIWQHTLELAGIRRGDRVLDIGCGTGQLAILASKLSGDSGYVAGIDLAPHMIQHAQKKAFKKGAKVDFYTGSISRLPFADGTFNIVLSSLTAHHLPRIIKEEGFAETCRVLSYGGRLVLCDFGPPADRFHWTSGLLMKLFAHSSDHPEDNFTWRLPQILRTAGFSDVRNVSHQDFLGGILRVHFLLAYKS